VKVHLLLDNEGYLPCFACLTGGKSHDITAARELPFQPGTIIVMDKGYVTGAKWHSWDSRLTSRSAYREGPTYYVVLRGQIEDQKLLQRNYRNLSPITVSAPSHVSKILEKS